MSHTVSSSSTPAEKPQHANSEPTLAPDGACGCSMQRIVLPCLTRKTLSERVWVAIKCGMSKIKGMSLYSIESPKEKSDKKTGYEIFASKMTTGIACASGGAVLGSFFGPVGSAVGAGAFGVTGFIFGKPSDAGKNK